MGGVFGQEPPGSGGETGTHAIHRQPAGLMRQVPEESGESRPHRPSPRRRNDVSSDQIVRSILR